jgi:hypothetical protein
MDIVGSAPVACPQCPARFQGRWPTVAAEAEQRCPEGHTFTATWPGFNLPVQVTVVEL